MTASLVNGLSSPQSFIPQAAATSNNSSKSDFSEVLNSSTSRESDKMKTDVSSKTDKSNKVEKTDKVESKPDDNDVKADKTAKDEKVENSDKVDSNKPVEDEDGMSDETLKQVAEVVATMIQTVADVLNVPVEQVEDAIKSIGMEAMEILDSTKIPELTVEITGAEDTMSIMTDEELFADVKELMETSNKLLTELADELNIPVDDLKQQISEEVADIKLAATEVKEEIPDDLPDTNAAEVSSVEVEKEVPKQETKREGTDRNESNNQMNFAQSIIDNLKSTVEDVQAEMPVTYTTTSMEDIMEQVTENLKVNMKEDLTEMEMQLHPASLGNVKIQVAARDGVITANFTTQNETVKEVLESQIVQLKEQMNEQGIKVEAVEVTVNTNAFERNFNDERDQSQRESENEAKRKRVRGINLTGADALSLDEMDEEDRVTADMMARQGNTVDYLA